MPLQSPDYLGTFCIELSVPQPETSPATALKQRPLACVWNRHRPAIMKVSQTSRFVRTILCSGGLGNPAVTLPQILRL